MAGEVGGGVMSGAGAGLATGAAIGSVVPGIGTLIGAAGGAIIGGIAGGIKGGQEKKLREQYEAKEKSIPLQDPNQVAYLDKIRRNQKALAAGTDPMTTYRMQEARNRGQQTALNLMRSSGGSTQALTSNILRANEGTNRAIAGAGADAFNKSLGLLAAEGTLVGSMADRAYNRQLSQARMLFAQYQQMKQDRVDQGSAALGSIGTLAKGANGETEKKEKKPDKNKNKNNNSQSDVAYIDRGNSMDSAYSNNYNGSSAWYNQA